MKSACLAFCFALAACTASREPSWEQVSRNPTLSSLRRYILLHPASEEASVARMQLEVRLARLALQDGGIARLQAFLQEFPDGAHAPQVRQALVEARARRALELDTHWALLRFLYLHPHEKRAAEVRERLEDTWWRELARNPNPEPRALLQYAQTYPAGKHTAQAQERLAQILYKKLGPDPAPELLQIFAAQHPQTAAGKEALAQLRAWERALILLHGAEEEQLRLVREGAELPADLLQVAAGAHVESALWAFETERLETWCAAVKTACPPELLQALEAWKKMKPAARDALSGIVRAAGPFRPMPALASLEVALHVEDLHTVWMAMEALAWRPEPRAFALLLQKAGDSEPAVAWPAADACRKWLARWPHRGRVLATWERRRLSGQRDRHENMARLVLLDAFLGHPLPTAEIAALPVAEPVVLPTLVLQAETLPQAPWDRLQEEWAATVNRLRDLFPVRLDAGSFPLARSLARRAFILARRFATLTPPPNAQAFLEHVTRLKTLLSEWETRLSAFPGYIRCDENPLPRQAAEHRLQQEAAKAKLLGIADPRQASFWKSVWSVPENSPYFPAQP